MVAPPRFVHNAMCAWASALYNINSFALGKGKCIFYPSSTLANNQTNAFEYMVLIKLLHVYFITERNASELEKLPHHSIWPKLFCTERRRKEEAEGEGRIKRRAHTTNEIKMIYAFASGKHEMLHHSQLDALQFICWAASTNCRERCIHDDGHRDRESEQETPAPSPSTRLLENAFSFHSFVDWNENMLQMNFRFEVVTAIHMAGWLHGFNLKWLHRDI